MIKIFQVKILVFPIIKKSRKILNIDLKKEKIQNPEKN